MVGGGATPRRATPAVALPGFGCLRRPARTACSTQTRDTGPKEGRSRRPAARAPEPAWPHLVEQYQVVDLLLHLALAPFLREGHSSRRACADRAAAAGSRRRQQHVRATLPHGYRASRAAQAARPGPRQRDQGTPSRWTVGPTFFLPLLLLAAAMALASFDFCTLGACRAGKRGEGGGESALPAQQWRLAGARL
jgi:hypothetical protein